MSKMVQKRGYGLDLAATQRKKETGAKPDLNSSPITVASLAVLCFVPI